MSNAMKRFGVFTLTFALTLTLLQGCESHESEYNNINENVTITDTKVSKMEVVPNGKFSYNLILFDKDGKTTEFKVGDALYTDIEKILNTAKMVGKEKETKFDVVTDGKDIISVTLVSNRK